MPRAPFPANEAARLEALRRCSVLDTAPDPAFDDLTCLAARLTDSPISLVSLVDSERQWFKSSYGLNVCETHRDHAFCAHAILGGNPLIIEDATADPRTKDNPLVTGPPHIRFYAGVPLITTDGYALGTLCVIDTKARRAGRALIEDVTRLARQATIQLEYRRTLRDMTRATERLTRTNEMAQIGGWELDIASQELTWSSEVYRIHEVPQGTPVSVEDAINYYAPESRPVIQGAVERALATGEAWDLELQLVTATGRKIWVRAQGEREMEGDRPVRVCGTFQDISHRKRMETRLKASEERARLAASVAQLGVWDWNLVTNRVVVDQRMFELYGIPPTDTRDIDFAEWMGAIESDEERAQQHRILSDAIDRRGSSQREFTIRRRLDGLVRSIHSTERVIYAPDGTPLRVVGVNRDVTDERQALAALRASETRFRTLALHAPVGIFQTDVEGQCVYVNEKWAEFTGLSVDQSFGNGWGDALHAEDRAGVLGEWKALSRGDRDFAMEFRLKRADGETVWVIGRAVALHDAQGAITGYLGTVEDITDRKQAEEKLLQSATHDELTGLPNRTLLLERIGACQQRLAANSSAHFAVLFLDFDRFKLINDSLGHSTGDQLLRGIADRLNALIIETGGFACRLGGDEFVVLLEDLDHPAEALDIGESILEISKEPYRLGEHEVVSTASIGMVTSETAEGAPEDILRDADTAMYEAKLAGKSRLVEFDGDMRLRVRRRLQLEELLRAAVEHDQLWLAYQPVVDMDDGRCETVEALLRWNHPEHGYISPAEFIPVAEETGLIIEIGERVFRRACADFVRLREAAGSKAPRTMSINVSRSQLAVSDLHETFVRIAGELGLTPELVQLEVTEGNVVGAPSDVESALFRLKEAGFKLAMDDFGTGLSSLSGLHQLPIDVLKIDRSFIENFATGRQFFALAQSVSDLARNLGLVTVAEGIETPEQVAALQTIGCDYGQGFLFARPMPYDQLVEFLRGEGRQAA